MRRRCCPNAVIGVVIGAFLLVACSSTEQAVPATLPLSETVIATDHTGPSDELAPSQITASTVAAPTTPGPCSLAKLEMWTAQVTIADDTADATIRLLNLADEVCEVDVTGSMWLDPAIEPNVWIDPGGWADLVVGQSGQKCLSPELVTLAEFNILGDTVVVPTAAITSCGWELTAFFPNDLATQPCDQLDTATVEGFVLIHNAGFDSCVLGELTAVDGHSAAMTARLEASNPSEALGVVDLAPGDVVAIPYTMVDGVSCDTETGPGSMTFDAAGIVPVEMIACGSLYELGAARPWFSDPNGPLVSFDPEQFDLATALAALAPFT